MAPCDQVFSSHDLSIARFKNLFGPGARLTMRWPWQRRPSTDRLVCAWVDQTLSYVLARQQADGRFEVVGLGSQAQGGDSLETFASSLQQLGLQGLNATFMLRSDQYQLLQIDTPAVPPEELRSAARYLIKDMLQSHVDDVTLDVVRVGDGKQHANPHSFVVAALNTVVRANMDLADAMDWHVSVIDIQEMAQRNLQSALAGVPQAQQQANAALVILPGQQALLTICATDELYYTRRFDVPEGFLTADWGQGVAPQASPNDAYTPVEEYVPDYAGSTEPDYLEYAPKTVANPPTRDAATFSADKAQRMVVEVQRSLDVWDRTWTRVPLGQFRVFAGERSGELAQWLGAQIGQSLLPMDVTSLFAGLDAAALAQHPLCLSLLGVLLRTDGGKS